MKLFLTIFVALLFLGATTDARKSKKQKLKTIAKNIKKEVVTCVKATCLTKCDSDDFSCFADHCKRCKTVPRRQKSACLKRCAASAREDCEVKARCKTCVRTCRSAIHVCVEANCSDECPAVTGRVFGGIRTKACITCVLDSCRSEIRKYLP